MPNRVIPYSSRIDSDGTLVSYPDVFRDLTPADATIADEKEQEIRSMKLQIEGSFLLLASMLHDFDDQRLYLARGYETMKQWCGSPEIDLSWRLVQDLLRIVREAIPILEASYEEDGVAISEALLKAGISKVRTALPLLHDPEVFVDAIKKAPEMSWSAMREEVKELQGNPMPIDQRQPVVFRGTFREGDEGYTRVVIHAMDGVTIEQIGTLLLRDEWVPRWEMRFGRLVERA